MFKKTSINFSFALNNNNRQFCLYGSISNGPNYNCSCNSTNYNSLSIIIYHDLLGFHCILKIIVAAPIKPPPALSFYKLIEATA